MTFIDWSDAEGLLDLLVEFVADETNDSHPDRKRHDFLAALLSRVRKVKEESPAVSPEVTITHLHTIHDSVDSEFLQDPVMIHLAACIEELENINKGS